MQAYPIIIVHRGNQQYIKECIKQAHFSNPKSRIILIGSDVVIDDIPFVEYYKIEDYFDYAQEFEKCYRHYSVNPWEFELFCFQRWFIIKEFIEKNNIHKFLHIDSDVLLYSDFTKEEEYVKNLEKYDYTISFCCAHTSFFNKQEVIARYCNLVSEYFKDDSFFAQFANDPNNPYIVFNSNKDIKCLKPLSDMTFWQYFSDVYGSKCLNTSHFIKNNSMINFNMYSHGTTYGGIGNIHNIIFNKENKPHLYVLEQNGLIRMHSLHFQGARKQLMPKYATYNLKEHIGKIDYNKIDLQVIFSPKLDKIRKFKRFKKAIGKAIKFPFKYILKKN